MVGSLVLLRKLRENSREDTIMLSRECTDLNPVDAEPTAVFGKIFKKMQIRDIQCTR